MRIGAAADTLTPVAEPGEVQVELTYAFSGSARAADGTLLIRTGRTVRRAAFKWTLLPDAEVKNVLTLLAPGSAYVEYPDPADGTVRTARFFVTGRKALKRRPDRTDLSVTAEEI